MQNTLEIYLQYIGNSMFGQTTGIGIRTNKSELATIRRMSHNLREINCSQNILEASRI